MKPEQKSSPIDLVFHAGRGFLMGTAEIIPGVSGGTVALIVGIYERLIDAITQVFAFAFSLVRFKPQAISKEFKKIDWTLIIPLGIGMLTAIVLLSKLLEHLLENYPAECRGLFFGLIAASVAIPWLRIKHKNAKTFLLILLAAILAFVASGLSPREISDPGYAQIFGSAMIAICAMIIPGVSGSFLLLVMGMYAPTLGAVNGIVESLTGGAEWDSKNLFYLLTFIGGAATGIGIFSRVLKWLLDRYHDTTMAILAGLMIGSLRALWPWQQCEEIMIPDKSEPVVTNCQVLLPGASDPVVPVILLMVGGFALVAAVVWWEQRNAS